MKAWGGIWLAFGLLSMLGCRTGREIDPAQSPWLNDWLLMHVNGVDERGLPLQQNFLLGLTPLEQGGHSVTFFATQSGAGGSDFRFGVSQGTVDLPGRRKSLAFSSAADSVHTGLRFHLDSKSLWLDIPIQKGSLAGPEVLRLKVLGRKWTAVEGPTEGQTRLWSGNAKDYGKTFRKGSEVRVTILGIPNLEAVLALGNGGSVVWLSASKERNPWAGFFQFHEGKLHSIDGFGDFKSDGPSSIRVDSVWHSKHSLVDYPVGFQVNELTKVSVSNGNQELSLGKRSFWMGAVSFSTDSAAQKPAEGNMVIFHPIRN